MTVHHVEVEPIDVRSHRRNLAVQLTEVRGQDRRRQAQGALTRIVFGPSILSPRMSSCPLMRFLPAGCTSRSSSGSVPVPTTRRGPS